MLSLGISNEEDVVRSRRAAREVAAHLGFPEADQARIATAVSEIVRNALSHAGGGSISFNVDRSGSSPALSIEVSDNGPGVADLRAVLDGYAPVVIGTPPRLGLLSARRLMDDCVIDSTPGAGTRVRMLKSIPADAAGINEEIVASQVKKIGVSRSHDRLAEIYQQNRELAQALTQLRDRQDELTSLNSELEDTNRGVVALYAELDAQAVSLRRADQMKSRFLANMSHEFRTPLNSILALSQILIERTDGDLSLEQEKQVCFIRDGAQTLYEMVNDLLDLAKIEGGKVNVQATAFDIANMFGALRGMLKPLLISDKINLSVIDPQHMPTAYNDEGKLAQILRNFVSNAIKFTECGEIRVEARHLDAEGMIEFAVSDTGIGIEEKDLERIFDEFEQVEHHLQKNVKGTGLGLPLCRKLAELMGGSVSVRSTPGSGSTFFARIPLRYARTSAADMDVSQRMPTLGIANSGKALVIDDSDSTRYVLKKLLTDFEVLEADNGVQGLETAFAQSPNLIFLDLNMPGMDGYSVLDRLRESAVTRNVPVIIVTSQPVERADRARLQGAQAVLQKTVLTNDGLRPLLNNLLNRDAA